MDLGRALPWEPPLRCDVSTLVDTLLALDVAVAVTSARRELSRLDLRLPRSSLPPLRVLDRRDEGLVMGPLRLRPWRERESLGSGEAAAAVTSASRRWRDSVDGDASLLPVPCTPPPAAAPVPLSRGARGVDNRTPRPRAMALRRSTTSSNDGRLEASACQQARMRSA